MIKVGNKTVSGLRVAGGGIDLGADVNFNLSQLLHHIFTKDYVTGTFKLTSALAATETEIFNTGLSSVTGCVIIDLTANTYQTGSTPEYGIFCYYETHDSSTYQFNLCSIRNATTMGTTFLRRAASYRWDNGKLYAKASFDGNSNYTPFYPNHDYRWIAWS